MSDKSVFNVNQKLFNQLSDWQNKMEAKDLVESEIEIEVKIKNKKTKQTNENQKDKLE
ncbi:MAG: hypothetical protein WBA93_37450 [Microcoleaceae cyanobacterium]